MKHSFKTPDAERKGINYFNGFERDVNQFENDSIPSSQFKWRHEFIFSLIDKHGKWISYDGKIQLIFKAGLKRPLVHWLFIVSIWMAQVL